MSETYYIATAAFIIGLVIGCVITASWAEAKVKSVSPQGTGSRKARTTLFSIPEPTAREIDTYANEHGVGSMMARNNLRKENLLNALRDMESQSDMRVIVGTLITYVRLSQ